MYLIKYIYIKLLANFVSWQNLATWNLPPSKIWSWAMWLTVATWSKSTWPHSAMWIETRGHIRPCGLRHVATVSHVAEVGHVDGHLRCDWATWILSMSLTRQQCG
jgi:hypothetical protein